jgi:hypothetical protein
VTRSTLAASDCEAIHEGFLGQPVNALSSGAYLVAGAALVVDAASASGPSRDRLVTFGLAVAANGIGGVGYHGPGDRLSRWVHDAALLASLGLILVTDAEGLRRRPPSRPAALTVLVASGAAAAHPSVSTTAQRALTALAPVFEVASRPARGYALTAGLGAIVHAGSRTGGPLCRPESRLQGHALWHVISALALWQWGRARIPSR